MKGRADGRQRSWVKLKCDCGKTFDAVVANLNSGNTTSCGCKHSEIVSARMTKHGMAKTQERPRLYRIWRGVGQRCNNPNARNYRWYGAKGIQRCAEWDDFQVFYNWAMSHGYEDGMELDRRDELKNYIPENCRWLTKKQNIFNRDYCLDDETEAALTRAASARGIGRYVLIAELVKQGLQAEGSLTYELRPEPVREA